MKLTVLVIFLYGSLANSQTATSQYLAQFFKTPNRVGDTIIENVVYTPSNVCPNRPVEVVENIAYSVPSRPVEENIVYPSCVLANRPVEVLENVVLSSPNMVVEANNMVLPATLPKGNTILITDCSPSACQSLSDTLQLMIVCNLLQNTDRGRDFALKLAGPVINQLITSPVLTCGCPNPLLANIPAPILPEIVTSTGPVDVLEAPVTSCSCQTLSGTVSSCPCQACASPVTCSCQTLSSPFSLYTCQNCASPLSPTVCQKCLASLPMSTCSKCSAPVPSCPCQAYSADAPVFCPACSLPTPSCPSCSASAASSNPIPPPPAPSCSCQACKACPNTLNAIISSFLNFV